MKTLFSANYYLSSYLLTFILSLANILESSHGPIHAPTASFLPPLYVTQNAPHLLLLPWESPFSPWKSLSAAPWDWKVLSKSLVIFPSLTGSRPVCPTSAFSTLITCHFWKAAPFLASWNSSPFQMTPLPLSIYACRPSGALFRGTLFFP